MLQKITVTTRNRLEAADLLYQEAQRLKIIARSSDSLTGPMLWLKIRDLENLAQHLKSADHLSDF